MKVKIPDSRILATIDEIRNPVVPLGHSQSQGVRNKENRGNLGKSPTKSYDKIGNLR